MALFLGLVVALTYGTGDFFGGLAARRVPVLWVVFLSHALAAVLVVAVVGLDRNADPTRHDIVIGIVAGVIGMVSVALFYKGLALGRMGVVAPLTAVVSAIVPVAWGLGFGERPGALALIGVALAIGSVALISSDAGRRAARAGHQEPHALVPRRSRRASASERSSSCTPTPVTRRHVAVARVAVDVGEPSSRSSSRSSLALGVIHRRAARSPSSPAPGCSTPRRTGSSSRRLAPGSSPSSARSARSTRRARCCFARGVLHERFHRTQVIGLDHRGRRRSAHRDRVRG